MENLKTQGFTLALRSGANVNGWSCEPLVDVFTLKHGSEELCDLEFLWDSGTGIDSCRVVPIADYFHASSLPFIGHSFQLMSLVMTNLDNAQAEADKEFYQDLFYDEDGNAIELPITLPSSF